jgi:hypothetical protein
MLTFNQIATRTADITGISTSTTTQDYQNIKQDIMQGLKLFKNAARRYWTRKQISANLVTGQQDYQLPADFVRITEVTITSNGIVYPLVEVPSEHTWNELNVIPAVTIYIPTKFFVKGNNVVSIWPAPSTGSVGTITVSYEPRTPDFSLNDVTGTASVNNSSVTVTDSATSFTSSMVGWYFTVTDGSDGNWYQVATVPSNNSLTLANYYQGLSEGSAPYLIGACPDIPEDYHLGLVYYAAYNFFLKRKDMGQAEQYLAMFEQLRDEYMETYANKTTGVVFTKQAAEVYSVFGIPPFNLTG